MTLDEWNATSKPSHLIDCTFGRRVLQRQRRLFLAGFARHLLHGHMTHCRKALKVAEEFADGTVTDQARRDAAASIRSRLRGTYNQGVILLAEALRKEIEFGPLGASTIPAEFTRSLAIQNLQCLLLRDVFTTSFYPVAFDPAWRTAATQALARQMYSSRDFAAMPILADALEDAGCDNASILDHCRDPKGLHVRGCGVVDLVLGKS